MQKTNYLSAVREQYENYPYPYRDPEDEKKRIVCGGLDCIAKINHYCYGGKCDFKNSFRILVAGGGTGDAAIFLAEQLRETNAQIVYLDVSLASMEIAKQRVQIRGFDNIEFVQCSLLDLRQMELEKFDYINCCGVLHHLKNPVEGLEALKSVLKNDGAVAIMIYGKYGRTGVYQMQELMRMINDDEPDMQIRIENTKAVLECLPETNWFKKAELSFFKPNKNFKDMKNAKLIYGTSKNSDVEIYDLFLHSQDKPFTVLEVYELVNNCGLNLVDFVETRAFYRPETFIKNPALLQRIKTFPIKYQQAIAELITGTIKKHVFYVSNQTSTIADPNDFDNIPLFYKPFSTSQLYDTAKDLPNGSTLEIGIEREGTAKIDLGKYTKYLLKYIDGYTSLKECFELIKKEKEFEQDKPTDREIYHDFRKIYDLFNLMDVMVLRHQSVPAFKMSYSDLQEPVTRKYNQEVLI
ncbi:MAG: class I SAM-dependent methyltransferase [Planctomycetes bacterium]|nr:class I SAM-dependent methyltransferase [Planctomycetota bacterium]